MTASQGSARLTQEGLGRPQQTAASPDGIEQAAATAGLIHELRQDISETRRGTVGIRSQRGSKIRYPAFSQETQDTLGGYG